jgi:hypothetical protein
MREVIIDISSSHILMRVQATRILRGVDDHDRGSVARYSSLEWQGSVSEPLQPNYRRRCPPRQQHRRIGAAMGCLSDVACARDLDFFNLPFLAEKFLGDKIKAYKDIAPKGRTFLELPFEEMKEHASAGADVALQLHGFLESALNERKIDQQFEKRTMPLALTLLKVEKDWHTRGPQAVGAAALSLEDSMLESKRCVADGIGSEIYVDSQDEISVLMSEKGQPGMNDVDHDDFLPRVLIGESSHRLSTRFLVGRPHG